MTGFVVPAVWSIIAGACLAIAAAVAFKLGRRWASVQDRFGLVLEAASNGLIMVDATGCVVLANTRAARIFGCTREELRRRSIGTLLRGVRFDGRGTTALLAMAGGEVMGRRIDGSEFPLELGVTPIEASDGVAAVVSVIDLTERKRADELLERERAFLRQVIDTAPNVIFAKDRDGRFTLANRALAQLYGTSVENLIGRMDSDFNHDAAEVAAFRRDDLRVMDTRSELFLAEERVTDASGRMHYVQTVKRPIVGDDGIANQVLGVATDITARKEAELQLGLQRNQLAHLSRVTMLAELSGSMAHELNQPLTAILSNAQAALRFLEGGTATPEELRAILEDIVADDKRAGYVIQGLRLLLTKGEMKREPIEVNAIVQDVLRILHSDLLHVGVDANVDTGGGLPPVLGDRVQLQQVLLNLILNGCDAMARSDPARRELRVSTAAEDGYVRVCVADRGHGIAPEHADKIFQPFFTTKDHGFGMGLSICRNIVNTHGGRLWAVANDGGGTKFFFTLPADSREAA
jgi:PAS domain S-box-containing protein